MRKGVEINGRLCYNVSTYMGDYQKGSLTAKRKECRQTWN